MEKYIRFEIEQRKHSGNALLGIFEHQGSDGRIIEKRDFILAFGHAFKKKEADKEIEKLCKFYNNEMDSNTHSGIIQRA
jgi:hypothetical protein